MMPSAPWNAPSARCAARPASANLGMQHEISEIFISGKAKSCRRAVDDGVHRIRKWPSPCRDGDDDEHLEGFFGAATPKIECNASASQSFSPTPGIDANGARMARSRNMLQRRGKTRTRLWRATGRSLGDHKPQHQQSRCHRRGAMTVGRDASRFITAANMNYFSYIYCKNTSPSAAASRRAHEVARFAPNGSQLNSHDRYFSAAHSPSVFRTHRIGRDPGIEFS